LHTSETGTDSILYILIVGAGIGGVVALHSRAKRGSALWCWSARAWSAACGPSCQPKNIAGRVRGLAQSQMEGATVEQISRALNADLISRNEKFSMQAIVPNEPFDLRQHQLIPGRWRMIANFARLGRTGPVIPGASTEVDRYRTLDLRLDGAHADGAHSGPGLVGGGAFAAQDQPLPQPRLFGGTRPQKFPAGTVGGEVSTACDGASRGSTAASSRLNQGRCTPTKAMKREGFAVDHRSMAVQRKILCPTSLKPLSAYA
jgi:hypothetical protein